MGLKARKTEKEGVAGDFATVVGVQIPPSSAFNKCAGLLHVLVSFRFLKVSAFSIFDLGH